MIPKLKKSNRPREYMLYPEDLRDKEVYGYLFERKTHRQLDEEYLELDMEFSKGYQSMGILHYLGLSDVFKGFFTGESIQNAITILEKEDIVEFSAIILSLRRLLQENLIQQMAKDIEMEKESDSYTAKNQLEGKKVTYYTSRYERNPVNRARAIEIHGTTCMACGFDFQKVYGEHGANYIEVHHVVPLSEREEEIVIDPKSDLVTVCSNCHRMIHRRNDNVLTLAELRKLIENKTNN